MKSPSGRNFTISILFVLFASLFLHSNVDAQTPVAAFNSSVSQGCSPLNVVFTNTSTNAVSFLWNFGNGNTSTQLNPSNVFTQPGNYTVTLVATSSSGQTNSYTRQISVVPTPLANFSALQTTGCVNVAVFDFQNTSTNYDSCVWDFGDGTTSNSVNPQHIYNISGVFSVKLVVFNKLYGCSNIKVLNSLITVLAKPVAAISVNDSVTCNLNTNFQFQGVISNAVNWLWNFGDGTTSSQTNPTHTYADTGHYNVSLSMISQTGCVDTIRKNQYIHIKWNPIPNVTISDDSGCKPHYVSILATYYSNANYSFDVGGTLVNSSAVYRTFGDTGIYPVVLTTNYTNGCSQIVNAGTISVFNSPTFSYSLSNFIGCSPLTVNFNLTSSGNYTWLWDYGDSTTSTVYQPTHTYTNSGSYLVSLTATNIYGCTFGYPLLNYRVQVNSPTADFRTDVISGCPPLQVNFSNLSIGSTLWEWDFGDGSTSTAQHPSHSYVSSGTYTVKLIAKNATGCSDTLIYSVPIVVAQTPVNYVPPATINGCVPMSSNFADASAASAWLWDFGDGTTSTLSNPNHTYTSPGIFVVSLTTWGVNGGCERTISNFQTFHIDAAEPGFTYSVSPCPPYAVTFTDTSLNAVAWSWDFGDGGSSTSQNPTHVYGNTGLYDVTLTATTPTGCNTTLTIDNGIVITGLGAHPSLLLTDTLPPFEVQFFANSTGATSWLWDFGDGSTSTSQNPMHIYATPGPFTISLSIANDSCSYTDDFPPISFGGSSSSGGPIGGGVYIDPDTVYNCAPYTVEFSSPDPSAIAWEWDFGDGTISNLQNPIHTYLDSGVFVPRIILTFANGFIDTLYYANPYFVVKPITDFNITTVNTCTGVIATTTAIGTASSYLWNFGNGITFNTPSATFTYPNVTASYLVSLSISDDNLCNSYVAKSFSVNSTSPISASTRRTCAGDSINFNSGNINYSAYLWEFGDGNSSSIENPIHAYADSGKYNVRLIVTDIFGCKDTFDLIYKIEVFKPVADFSYTISSNCTTVVATLLNNSTGNTSWIWGFSDGTRSATLNPIKLFSAPGYYDITLIANNNICSDTLVVPNAVYVSRPVADFSFTQSAVCLPITANFTSLSIDAVSWEWDFGDGSTSSLENPTHVYTTVPLNSVVLTIKDINGCELGVTKTNIQVTKADFVINAITNCNPATIILADSSINAISWQWNFGDGSTSNLQNPSHTYTVDGLYDIELIVESSSGCFDTLKLDTVVSVLTSTASFIADSTSGCAPLFVSFADGSLNAVDWQWDFGDGSYSSLQNPSHIYSLPGKYSVSLIVTNANGCVDTLIINDYINVYGALPNFSISTTNGCSPLTVEFTDLSLGAIDWDWNFGDGNIDSVQNPVHVYADSGSFVVTLYAIDSVGCYSVYTYPQPITTSPAPYANFIKSDSIGCNPVIVNFDELNTSADSLIWIMGDGTTLYGSKPSHIYSVAGTYYITLIAKNSGGCIDSIVDPVPVVVHEKPLSNFTTDIQQGCMPVNVNFTNSSLNLINPTFYWDFGNGDTSNLENPTYTYQAPGVYSPFLIITNQGGCTDTIILNDLITVFDQLPPAASRIYRVSVVNNDHVKINWQLNTAPNIDYYVIYRFNNTSLNFDSIAMVSHNSVAISGNAPEYIDSGLNTLANSYTYKVAAVDRCGYQIPLSALRAHSTMELSSVAGFMKVDLDWTPYIGCEISTYEIYRKENGGAFALIANVDTSQTSFTDATAVCPFEFTYAIRAVNICEDPNFDSWSDTSSATPQSDISNQTLDITRSTVVDDKFVLTEWRDPIYRPDLVDRYNIFRSMDSINYSLISSVPAGVHEYSDYNVDVDVARYFYRVEIQNVCNTNTLVGRISSSIFLRAIQNETSNSLMWTRYVDWDSGVEKYIIEKLNNFGNWEEVEVVTGKITEWVEE
jgi:PKD repeat protein